MDAGLIDRIESGAERGASALFAAAVAYAAYRLLTVTEIQPQLGLWAAGAGALAYLPCSLLLAAINERGAHFALPDFAVANFDFVGPPEELLLTERVGNTDELLLTERVGDTDELLLTERVGDTDELILTDADRADRAPLVLDDILAELEPDARVVRLFDRRAMPQPKLTPGQLQSRIADHLADGAPLSAPSNPPAAADASQALSDALAELRRSLR